MTMMDEMIERKKIAHACDQAEFFGMIMRSRIVGSQVMNGCDTVNEDRAHARFRRAAHAKDVFFGRAFHRCIVMTTDQFILQSNRSERIRRGHPRSVARAMTCALCRVSLRVPGATPSFSSDPYRVLIAPSLRLIGHSPVSAAPYDCTVRGVDRRDTASRREDARGATQCK